MKKMDKVRDYFARTPVGDIESVKKLVGSAEYARLVLNIMSKKGEITRIARGFYSAHKDPEVAVYCFRPAYIGLHDALSLHNLWEQETVPVIITSRKIRPGQRKAGGFNIILRRIEPRYLFGFDYMMSGNFSLPVSDIEKTFIDFFYFREMRKDIIRLFRGRLDRTKLGKYTEKYPARFRKKVMAASKSL